MNNFSTTGTLFSKNFSLNLGGRILDLGTPCVMGIINVTPDSFYGESRMAEPGTAVRAAREMLMQGASILDVGAMSSRPGAGFISEAEELDRLMPVLEALKSEVPGAPISVDTWRSGVAREAGRRFGIHMINDISSGDMDPEMYATVASLGVPYVMMHKQGDPSSMQDNPEYRDVVDDLIRYFADRVFTLRKLGVRDIIIDPGFGFGKTLEHNYQLLHELSAFRMMELPLMVGISRKSMICQVLKVKPENALNGTTAAHMAALLHGASILRVHDVGAAVETVRIFQHIVNNHSRRV
ncbi:MAG: dihydropteroate synthase [Bacteroidetes bacterium]|nr:MAG: dihydropteroate synthase [Bacteroidota bacterium]